MVKVVTTVSIEQDLREKFRQKVTRKSFSAWIQMKMLEAIVAADEKNKVYLDELPVFRCTECGACGKVNMFKRGCPVCKSRTVELVNKIKNSGDENP